MSISCRSQGLIEKTEKVVRRIAKHIHQHDIALERLVFTNGGSQICAGLV
jgi:hypothetical protein